MQLMISLGAEVAWLWSFNWHIVQVQLKAYATGIKPEDLYRPRSLPEVDVHSTGSSFPKIAVQLPMFNERAVCQAIIDSACEMHWPWHKLRVQVLDCRLCSQVKSWEWPQSDLWQHAMMLLHCSGAG